MTPVRWLGALTLCCLTACTAKVGSGGGQGSPNSPGTYGNPTDPAAIACAAAPINVPLAALQRLTPTQYLNTERDLFGAATLTFTLDPADATSPVITQLEVEKMNNAGPQIVATGGHYKYAACNTAGAFNDTCAQGFIGAFGLKAFRRPVTADELTWLTGVYQNAKAITGVTPAITFKDALDVVAQVMIQSPQHLYTSPQGTPDPALPTGIQRLTGYERATRLAYLMTDSMPDDALLTAAGAGQLDTPAGVRAQASRLLNAASGHATVRAFAYHYLGLDGDPIRPDFSQLPKDPVRFPLDSPALRADILNESESFLEHVFYDEAGSFQKLMTSPEAYVNSRLATLYGLSGGPSSPSTFQWMNLDTTQRAGIFTRTAFLTEMANQDFESPIQRGQHLFKNVLCQQLGNPPQNMNLQPANAGSDGGVTLTVRQQTDARTSPSTCSGCHAQFNPIGFALGSYDAMGQWQTADTGKNADGSAFSVPVDTQVQVPHSDIAGPVSGGVALSQALAKSAQAQACMAQAWFAHVTRRRVAKEDTCTVMALETAFSKSGDMSQLVLDAASSSPALYVRVSP